MRKELFDCWFEFSVGHIFLSDEAATARVGLDGTRTSAQLLGKAAVLGITRASIGMNIDWTRLRQRFDASESIIGKKNSPVFVCDDGAQAVTAWSVVRGQLGMRGKSIDRGTKGCANRFRHFGGNGNDANG